MAELRSTIERVAPHRTTVLITGESGTGKELVARAIHELSPRRDKPFVAINCAAIAPTLLESELFGHMRGAFTDAQRDRAGLFEEANGGTLFLDEIGEIPLGLQAKLLRVLQESEVRRVGATSSIKIDVRIVTATLRDLSADVETGRFREDLFYRLNVLPIVVPSLRQRTDDVAMLASHFADQQNLRHHRPLRWSPDALLLLQSLSWPGNVRELENLVERATVLVEGDSITSDFVRTLVGNKNAPSAGRDIAEDQFSIKKATRILEEGLIRKALLATDGNRTNAAKLLEISHRALLYKIKEYGIARSENLDK
jgi:two-component system, NtrC family, response regulator AtoC